MEVASTLWGVLGFAVAGGFGLLGHWLSNKAQKQANTTVDWDKLAERYDKQLDSLQADLDNMRSRLDRVEAALAAEERRSWSAITYIRRLLRWITETMPEHVPPAPPDLLKDDL